MSTAIIRLATEQDAAAIQAIYAPYVRDTPFSFEYEEPTIAEIAERIRKTLPAFPWLVCERDGQVVGYVYAGSHRERAAYQWCVNVAVYIASDCHRSGMGRALYTSLFCLLVLQGYYQAFAGITLPNPGSIGLHEALGFRKVGEYQAVGYKLGTWHDTGWWQRTLQEPKPDSAPTPPIPLDALSRDAAWEAALCSGLPFLRL